MSSRFFSLRAVSLVLFGLALVVGSVACTTGPRAPDLEDSSVYSNEREGFRFLVPEGWFQQSRAAPLPGPATQERLLVTYRCFENDPPAGLEVGMIDLPADADLGRYLEEHPWSGQKWRVAGAPQPIQAGNVAGQQFSLEPESGSVRMVREVVVVRRQERVYFFNGIFGRKDNTRREQFRQVATGLHWN
jgi:hypothetical protein